MTLWTWNPRAQRWTPSVLPGDRPHALSPSATLIPLGDGRYGVLAGARTRVNGESVLPLRVLDDRDELQLTDGSRRYVSLDDRPAIVPFPGSATRCARCGGALQSGEPACRCPRCQVLCHETDALPCWTDFELCPACPQPTRGFSWEPAPLGPVAADGQTEADDV